MAFSSLFALIDDIATLLDDVAAMTKVAAGKTAGVLGDDLALNAQQLAGIRAERELPVVWAVAKGSLVNKAILVPAALAISALAPWGVRPLLMIGGAYLCFEGVEKLAQRWLHPPGGDAAAKAALARAFERPEVDLVAFERDKIKGAIRTDFVLSAEIIVIALGTVAAQALGVRFAVLAGIALLMTAGVYGLVAAIVKLDDAGLWLLQREHAAAWTRRLGALLLHAAPGLMRGLSVAGTAAMFLVGGGILAHGWPSAHHVIQALGAVVAPWPAWLATLPAEAALGVAAGAAVLAAVTAAQRLRRR